MRRRRAWMGSLVAPALLAACGGGGGVNTTPAPPVTTPTPIATPAPTPTPSAGNDTAEYRATVGAVSMNALAAYNRGATGAGINVAVIDSGIDLQSQEFGGRISPASADVAGNGSIDDVSGHGTAVAFTLAGRRNGVGTQGVAFDATLTVLRADRPGSCTATTTGDADTCRFATTSIAQGVDAARAAGARVINMSLDGAEMPANLQAAIGRATAAGIVVVIAAGNDGTADPNAFSAVANTPAIARGLVIVAGSVGSTDTISSFSDRAGASAAHYLAAVGEEVRAPAADDAVYLWSGTSFAAPQISAAVALLAQAFPNLSGAQIVDLLQRTARDAGASGVDAIYGNGILDLTRAFQPVGATSLAGTAGTASLIANAALSAPMGDATTGAVGAVLLDGYGRAFAVDLAGTIAHAAPVAALAPALLWQGRTVVAADGATTVAMTLAPLGPTAATLDALRLTGTQATAARALAAAVTRRFAGGLSAGVAFAQSGAALADRLAGRGDPAFLVADPVRFEGTPRIAGALRQQLGPVGVTTAIEQGRTPALPRGRPAPAPAFTRTTLALDGAHGPVALRLAAIRLDERASLLGARFDAALGAPRATTWFAEAGARLAAGGWTLGGSLRRGWTDATARDGVAGHGRLRTSAFAADIGRDGIFGRDSLGLRLAQPLRVDRGGLDLALPTGWDYALGEVSARTVQHLDLAPAGRELDVEARYAVAVGPGALQTHLFWRHDPGNWSTLAPDYGLALRYGFGF